jgi:NAD(P)-dependent dehydrogenase (short-subunit alcohol dehydrogenase family)
VPAPRREIVRTDFFREEFNDGEAGRQGRLHHRRGAGLGYTAAKHGVVGLMRSYANNLAPHSIRVNTVHPTGVNTPMVVNDVMQEFLAADPSLSRALANALPVPMVEPVDISNAIAWLVSDDARYVTGVTLPVDAGFTNKK